MRSKRFFYNTISSLLGQIITIICGMILPRVMIAGFGSELYGTTTSIAEFLGYISLLEGGIGAVARSALYKPLAEHDVDGINAVVSSVKQFFSKLAVIFVVYTLIIACTYKNVASEYIYDWSFTFFLVIVISLSTFAEYFFGITNFLLIQADQRAYVVRTLQSLAIALNTILACILIYFQCNIFVVKFAYCFVHFIRIFVLSQYVKKRYQIKKTSGHGNVLQQKWDCLAQHIAYFLHSKTDIFVLTVFTNMREIAVYSIYNYITTSLVVLASSFIAGSEAVFGNMLAKHEEEKLMNFFELMEFMIHVIVIVFFSTAAVVFMPFIHIYTNGISDADYYRPMVAYLLLIAEGIYCLRQPYHQMAIAAGEFKSTRTAAFIEAGLNIGLSCFWVRKYGMSGVALATVMAMAYRTIYYVYFLTKNIIKRSLLKFVKRWIATIVNISAILVVCSFIPCNFESISNYFEWVGISVIVGCISIIITGIFSMILYRKECKQFIDKCLNSIGIKNINKSLRK